MVTTTAIASSTSSTAMKAPSSTCVTPAKPSNTSTPSGVDPSISKPSSTKNQPSFTTTATNTARIKSVFIRVNPRLHLQRFTYRWVSSNSPNLGIEIVVNKRVAPEE